MFYFITNNFRTIGAICVFIFAGFAFLCSYKWETLICNIKEKNCSVERTTYLNEVNTIYLMDPHNIKDVVIEEKIHRVRRGDRTRREPRYSIVFIGFDGVKKNVYSREYHTFSTAEKRVDEIKRQFKSGNNIIEVSR